jgi:hypothetical protein
MALCASRTLETISRPMNRGDMSTFYRSVFLHLRHIQYITIFMKDNQYYASQYQHSAITTLLICWQCILRETGKTSQAFVHLPQNFTVGGTALVSAARKTDHRTYMQYVVLPQHLAFFACNQRLPHPIQQQKYIQYAAHNWIIDVTGVTPQKRATTGNT